MKKINLLILGGGMYVCGRNSATNGTIFPSLLDDDVYKNIDKCFILNFSKTGQLKTKNRIHNLNCDKKINVSFDKLKNLEKIILKNSFDAAIVCLPDNLHYKYLKIILLNKINVITVKPFVLSTINALELIELKKKNGLIGQVDFHKRYDTANLFIKDKIINNDLGDLLYSTVEYSQPKDIPLKVFKSWSKNTNIFNYLGVHYADLIHFLTNFEPLSVYAIGSKKFLYSKKINTYDYIQAIIEWIDPKNKKRFTSTFNLNWIESNNSNAISDQRIIFCGTQGKIKSDQTNRGISFFSKDGLKNPNPYFSEKFNIDNKKFYSGYGIDTYKKFIFDVIQKKKIGKIKDQNLRATFESSLSSVAISEAITKSLKSQKIETITSVKTNNFIFKSLRAKKNLNKGEIINKKNFEECIELDRGVTFKSTKGKKLKKKMKKNEFINYSHIYNL